MFLFQRARSKKNIDKAVYWFRKGADQGNADAQANLGFCYITGQGVLQNKLMAISLWEKAAKQGHRNAIRNLEICRMNGDY